MYIPIQHSHVEMLNFLAQDAKLTFIFIDSRFKNMKKSKLLPSTIVKV